MSNPLLYSFRRCPYAMRARWALLVSGLLVNLREVALKNKPPELLQASQKGTVPVLMTADGTEIDESMDIMYWALQQADPFDGLRSGKAGEQKAIQQLIEQNDGPFKYHLDRFKYGGGTNLLSFTDNMTGGSFKSSQEFISLSRLINGNHCFTKNLYGLCCR